MNFTTYFAMVRSLPRGCFPISIANAPPSMIHNTDFGEYKWLFPGHEILSHYKSAIKHAKNESDIAEAERIYRESYYDKVLSRLYQGDVLHDCMLLARNYCERNGIYVKPPSFALVCYERPEKFCHRHLVREWITEIYPNAIDEYSSWRRWKCAQEELNGTCKNAERDG